MNAKAVLIGVVTVGFALSAMILTLQTCATRGVQFGVSFLKAEPSHGEFPMYIKGKRFDLVARNRGPKSLAVYVTAWEDEQGSWVSLRPPHNLGKIEARKTTQLYLYLPAGIDPMGVRMRVFQKASLGQRFQHSLCLLIDKAAGRYKGRQVWFDELNVPAYDFVVKLGMEAEQVERPNERPAHAF